MTVRFTHHGRTRAAERHITEQMIHTTISKLNLHNITDRKIYIIDKALNYILVADICRSTIYIITIMVDKGAFDVRGNNPLVRSVC